MLQRQTQLANFWKEQFEITEKDLEFLHTLLLDAQAPKSLSELAIALIQEYVRQENAKINQELSKGEIYNPQNTYQIGQTLVFPALEFTVGQVVETRLGHNPEHGTFDVIKVRFESSMRNREFASDLKTHHRLSQGNGNSQTSTEQLLAADELYSLYQGEIDESMLYALEEGDLSENFVEVDGNWILTDMLTDIHFGHLNIAEAMIDMLHEPLSSEQLLTELDMDDNSSQSMQLMSLNHALNKDERFDRVGRNGEQLWFLKRLEPKEVLEVPLILRHRQLRYNRALLSVELLQIEWELHDEWGESSLNSEMPNLVPSTSFSLTYPHRVSGTLPLNGRTRNFFPMGRSERSMVTLIDGRWGTHHTGWVVEEGRYVTGLRDWMNEHSLPVGAFITLERTSKPNEVVVDFRARRSKREWARIATPDLDKLQLSFELNKVQVSCEYDEHLIVAEADGTTLEELRKALIQNRIELAQIVEQMVPELTRLSPQGTVHAKTVYSAVNMLRRCSSGPIFYALISNRKFRDIGAGFFALA